MAETTTSTDAKQSQGSEVGTILRRRREAHDLELTQVATTLRIRREYLAALENNTLEGMPGPAYAMGFLRTYADYLGLDSVDIVRRYRASTNALNDKPSLTFPMPLTERGVPGGGLFLLTTIVLIALGYGTWYYISSGQHQTLAAVEPVPAQLAAIAPPPPQPHPAPAPAPPPAPAITPPPPPSGNTTLAANAAPKPPATPAPIVTDVAADGLPSAAAPPTPGTPQQIVALPPSPPANPAPADPDTNAPMTADSQTAAAAPPPPIDATSSVPPAVTPAATPLPDPGQGSLGAAPVPAVAAAPTPPPAATPAADVPAVSPVTGAPYHVYGQPKPARVVARAISKSWIQVSDAEGHTLTTRTMEAGDVYNAPDQKGLYMHAGNVGALQFTVDGHLLPPIGKSGQVMRHINLDPASLSHGTIQ